MAMAAERTFMSCEQIIPTEDFPKHGPLHTQRISRLMTTGVIERAGAAHFTECPPDYGRDEAFQKEYAATAKSRRGVGRVQGQVPRRVRRGLPATGGGGVMSAAGASRRRGLGGPTRAEVCCVAVAEAFRGDGERLRQPHRHHPDDRWPAGPRDVRARPGDDRRVRRRSPPTPLPPGADPADAVVEAWNPYPQMFAVLWNGKRHVMMGATPGRPVRATRTSRASATGTSRGPSCSGSAARPATRSTTPPATGCRRTARRCSSTRSTSCAASATTGRAELGPDGVAVPRDPPRRLQPRRASTSRRPTTRCAFARCTPASPSTRSSTPPASSWSIPDDVPESRLPDRRGAARSSARSSTRAGLREKEVPNP